jgi:EpsI family protein
MMLFVPSLALGAGVLLVAGMREQFSMTPRAPMATIDKALLGEIGTDVAIPKEEQAVAGMSDFMMRSFGPDSNPRFSVYVGYYDKQVQGKSIHSPKNCLPGAGWEILEAKRVPFPRRGAAQTYNRVVLANKSYRALVAYWYQGRGRIESSEYKVKWNLMRDAALYGRTEESLVRLVIPVGVGSKADEFAKRLAEADSLVNLLAPRVSSAVAERMPTAPGAVE